MPLVYKYFTTRYTNILDDAQKTALKKEFPGMHFTQGMHKDRRGVFVTSTKEKVEYGERFELPNGDVFFPPKSFEGFNPLEYETPLEDRIEVSLMNGEKLRIFPASAIPKRALFRKRMGQEGELYNRSNPYGCIAYDFYFMPDEKKKNLKLEDPEVVNFVEAALKASYTLPIEMWDAMGWLCEGDYDPIILAALGYKLELQKKT